MTSAVNPIPNGYHSVTPYLTVQGADRLMEFMIQVFGAREKTRMSRADGTIGHAEVRLGDSVIMLAEAGGDWPPMPGAIHLYLDDCDAVYQRALEAGADSAMPPADQFYGDRMSGVRDPFGNLWWIVTHVEDVSPEEMHRRAQAAWQPG
jgi:PhnB protein